MSRHAGGWPACFNEFFGRLSGVIDVGPQAWKSVCPAHSDHVQSLSVRIGNKGHLWVRCHACMAPHDVIVKSMGLEIDDLFSDNKRYTQQTGGKKVTRKFKCAYQYRDEAGKLLFEAIRYEPKGFSQRRPNPDFDPKQPPDNVLNSEYIYNMEGVRRVPYMLPKFLAAFKHTPQKTILILEGEKDVDLAWSVGLMATCNPMGAGKWLPEFAEFFVGRNVVVVPDEDPVDPNLNFSPGVRHAESVCESLVGKAATVRMVRLPIDVPKGDFSDWWAKQSGQPEDRKKLFGQLATNTKLWGKAEGVIPATVPTGTTAVPTGSEPTKEEPKKKEEAKPAEVPKEEPKPEPKAEPVAVPIDAPKVTTTESKKEDLKVVTIPADRAARVNGWFRDVKLSGSALKAAGIQVRSVHEYYGLMRMAIAEMDSAMTLRDGSPTLDLARLGQVSLLMAGYSAMAAAELGIGCGLVAEPKKEDAKTA